MRRGVNILRWTAGVLGGMILLTVAVLLAIQPYLNAPGVRRSIEKDLSRRIGGTATFRHIDAALFPLPVLTFQGVDVAIPKTMKARIESVSVYPRLFPLLQGKILLSRLRVREPEIVITLPETIGRTSPDKLSLDEVKATIGQVLAWLVPVGPGLVFEMDSATIGIAIGRSRALTVRKAGAKIELPPGPLFVDLHGSSDPWGAFRLTGSFLIDAQAVRAEDVDMQLGHSELANLAVRLDWGQQRGFKVREGRGSLDLGELFSWASPLQLLQPLIKDVRSLRGKVDIQRLSGGGSLADPGSWTWTVGGRMQEVVVKADRLPAALSLSGDFISDERSLSMTALSASLDRCSLSMATVRVMWNRTLHIKVQSGRAVISLEDINRWFPRSAGGEPGGLAVPRGTVRFSSLAISGPLFHPLAWKAAAAGTVENVLLDSSWLPSPVRISRGAFTVRSNSWSFSGFQAKMRDSSLTLSGSVHRFLTGVDRASVVVNGSLGGDTIRSIYAKHVLPPQLLVRSPLLVSGLRIGWQKDGMLAVGGTARIDGGPSLAMDLQWMPGTLHLKKLALSDAESSAVISADYSQEGRWLSFSGHLAQSTVRGIFEHEPTGPGKVEGDLSVKMAASPSRELDARGTLEVSSFDVPWERKQPLRIVEISLRAAGTYAVVQKAVLNLGGSKISLSGTVSVSGSRITVDANASADRIIVSELTEILSGTQPAATKGQKAERTAPFTVEGLVRLSIEEVRYDAYRFDNVTAQAAFGEGYLRLTVREAKFCGLLVPGKIVYERGHWEFDIQASAASGSVDKSLACLAGGNLNMTGAFDLRAELRSKDDGDGLVRNLEGKVDFSARDGKIYRYPMLAKILSVLSVTEVLRGKVPELGGNGFPYNTMMLKANIEKGKLTLDHALIDGTSVTIIAEGDVDLPTRQADMIVLAAPFSTINWIIRHIPIIGHILGGTLISIPVKVSGDLSDPKVVFLSPSAVGSRTVTFLENVVKAPVELVSPLFPKQDQEGK